MPKEALWSRGHSRDPPCEFTPPVHADRMLVAVLIILALLLTASIWILWPYVYIRRKDCCGKGCGCLFPVNKPPLGKRQP